MLLTDEVTINYESAGNLLHEMLNSTYLPESGEYVYRQGDYIIVFNSDDIMSECKTIALNEEGQVVETTYKTLMSGETKEHKLLSDEELSKNIKYIHAITPSEEWELWEDKVSDPWDWDMVQFILKHRPDLMI
jgi:hypothetical protein